MQPEDILVALGETGAVFAGFGGIVAALGARSVTELPPIDRFRFSNLLVISVSACLLAFLPIVLEEVVEDPSTMWNISTATLALFALIFLLKSAGGARRIGALRGQRGRLWMAVLSVSVLAAIFVIQSASLIGWPRGHDSAVYVAGIFGLLILSGLQFILLALDATPGNRL
jgi:hypothetical protein